MSPEKRFSLLSARSKADIILNWMDAHKARHLVAFDLAGTSPVTEINVVASASSARHARSLSDGLLELCAQEGFEFLRVEGYEGGVWVLADLNDVVVHILQESARELYQLESLWREVESFGLSADAKGATACDDQAEELADSHIPAEGGRLS